MARYINDKNIIKLASSDKGVDLIVSFIEDFGEEVIVDRKSAYPDILIQTVVHSLKVDGVALGVSNTVGISENQIYVNPWGPNNLEIQPITQLYMFIQNDMISLIRDSKLNELGI